MSPESPSILGIMSLKDVHQHEHSHNCHQPVDFGNAFKVGIALNVVFVLIEAVCGFLFHSVSLLADAGHNLSDVFGLLLAYVGFRLATVKPSARFTYGLGSSTILAATLNGAILLLVVGGIAWEAIGRFNDPTDVYGSGIIWVAAIGVIINTGTAMLFFRGRSHDLNIKGAFLHMMADAIVSLGVVVAGTIIMWKGWMWIDPFVSLMIATVILYSTWELFRDSLMLLSHGVPKGVDVNKVRRFLAELPGVEAVHDLHIWALSTTKTAMTVHLVKPEIGDADQLLAKIANTMQDEFGVDHCTVQIELNPDKLGCKLVPDEEV